MLPVAFDALASSFDPRPWIRSANGAKFASSEKCLCHSQLDGSIIWTAASDSIAVAGLTI